MAISIIGLKRKGKFGRRTKVDVPHVAEEDFAALKNVEVKHWLGIVSAY